jgi:hypothetical protein
LTVNVKPATVSVPARAAVAVLAAIEYPTLPLPLPEAPLVMVTQDTLLAAVQVAVEEAAVTVIVPVEAPVGALTEVVFKENGAAAWLMLSVAGEVCPAPVTLIEPDLAAVVEFAATV